VIPMIMNREMFFTVAVLVAFAFGALFGYLRGRRTR
jgi:hypothetical protein